jgi:RNA polymerase sigma factor (sigma-70 family)
MGSQPGADHTDGMLLHRFVHQQEQAAFTALVQRHGPMVLGACRRILNDEHEAEDVFQATFLVLVRKARSLHQYGSLGNWLYTVAYHLALKTRARSARRRDQEGEGVDVPDTSAGAAIWNELRPVLDAELDRLPSKYREPVVLCYLEGKTNEEAASELGWPIGTLKIRLARARELLKDRLTRRGMALSVGLLAPNLAERASSAVSAGLLQATTEAATLFAVGNTMAAGAVAARPVFLAQGALRAMFVSKLKLVAALFLTFGLAAYGTGVLLSQDSKLCPAGGTNKDKHPPASPPPVTLIVESSDNKPEALPPAKAADPAPPPAAPPSKGVPIRRQVAQLITLEVPADTPLKDALEMLAQKTNVPLIIDIKAFEAIGVQKVEEQPVQLPKMANIRLSTALELLMKQIKGDVYHGVFQVRGDHVEMTTTYNLLAEAGAQPVEHPALREPTETAGFAPEIWTDPTRRMTRVVPVDIDRRPLAEALREFGEQVGYQVVVDARVADKAKTPVSLALDRVWFDTAVTLLLEPTDLDWVWVDSVVYVTSKENARLRRERQKAREAERVQMLREKAALRESGVTGEAIPDPLPAAPGKEQARPLVEPQPLENVLQELARTSGIKIVIDPRTGDKAKTPVAAYLVGSVAPATAMRLLADMAGLKAVTVDKVIYVTTKENAKSLVEQAPEKSSNKPTP